MSSDNLSKADEGVQTCSMQCADEAFGTEAELCLEICERFGVSPKNYADAFDGIAADGSLSETEQVFQQTVATQASAPTERMALATTALVEGAILLLRRHPHAGDLRLKQYNYLGTDHATYAFMEEAIGALSFYPAEGRHLAPEHTVKFHEDLLLHFWQLSPRTPESFVIRDAANLNDRDAPISNTQAYEALLCESLQCGLYFDRFPGGDLSDRASGPLYDPAQDHASLSQADEIGFRALHKYLRTEGRLAGSETLEQTWTQLRREAALALGMNEDVCAKTTLFHETFEPAWVEMSEDDAWVAYAQDHDRVLNEHARSTCAFHWQVNEGAQSVINLWNSSLSDAISVNHAVLRNASEKADIQAWWERGDPSTLRGRITEFYFQTLFVNARYPKRYQHVTTIPQSVGTTSIRSALYNAARRAATYEYLMKSQHPAIKAFRSK